LLSLPTDSVGACLAFTALRRIVPV